MKALSWINVVLGVLLIIAGFTLSGGVAAVMAERVILGLIIALLAIASVRSHSSGLAWCVAFAGLWTLVAPAVIHYGRFSVSSAYDHVVGAIVLVLGFVNAVYRRSPVRAHA